MRQRRGTTCLWRSFERCKMSDPNLTRVYASKPTSGTAIAGLVLGILSIVSSWIPIVNNISFVIGVVGLILAIVGVVGTVQGKRNGKGLAIAGLVINVISLVIVILTQFAFSSALDAVDDAFSGPEVTSVSDGSDTDAQDGNSAKSAMELSVGDTIEMDNGLSVTVNSVETGLVNWDESTVIGVNVTYVNNGSSTVSYNELDWKGEDSNGAQEYSTYYSEDTGTELSSGSLAAGGTKTGTIYFEGDTVKVLYFGGVLDSEPSAAWIIG